MFTLLMRFRYWPLSAVIAVLLMLSCERVPKVEINDMNEVEYRRNAEIHARDWAITHARSLIFIAQEHALLNPSSRRARVNREAGVVVQELLKRVPDSEPSESRINPSEDQ